VYSADDSEWRKDNYFSEYTKTNSEVHPLRSMTDEAKEHAFYKWMARQQLYYKDLLKAGGFLQLCLNLLMPILICLDNIPQFTSLAISSCSTNPQHRMCK
jgi:hypothetical protein